MNKYHIYDEIGRGQHSKVFKGRKKKTVDYYAIKSVDKTQRERVQQEVRAMHNLSSGHVLRFYAWFETNNHLWLILEYCVGGDLMSLLRQDSMLPESSIHDFARDLVTALQFLHHNEIIYCDLKPSNILLDENGRIKLGGFGLSRRLSDINETPLKNLAPAKRGTPCYMAPELLQQGATHSTASDLWALGCVLYECAAGQPPFVSQSFNQLVHSILNDEPAPIQGASADFQDILDRLLSKNPATRMGWPEMRAHPFFNFPLPELSLPHEPALQAFMDAHNLRPAPAAPAASKAACLHMRRSVDISRLSQAVQRNLAVEGQSENVEGAATAGAADVQLANADAEVDFQDRGATPAEGSGVGATNPDANGAQQAGASDQGAAVADGSGGFGESSGVGPSAAPSMTSRATGQDAAASSDRGSLLSHTIPLEAVMWQPTDLGVRPIVGNPKIEKPSKPRYEASALPFEAWSMEQFKAAPKPHINAFLKAIIDALYNLQTLKDKLSVLSYFETLCGDQDAANLLVNSSLTTCFVSMLADLGASGKLPQLRVRLASVLGLLLRHATEITEYVETGKIVEVLSGALSDRDDRVRRKAMATMGELLFYIATTEQDTLAEGGDLVTVVPVDVFDAIITMLRAGEDEVAQHYAVKTIENVATKGWSGKFAQQRVLNDLYRIFKQSRNDNLKCTAVSTLSRLIRYHPALTPTTRDGTWVRALAAGMRDGSSRVRTAFASMLLVALTNDPGGTHRSGLGDIPWAVPAAVALLEAPQTVLRAKGVVLITVMARLEYRWALQMCGSDVRLMSWLQKLQSDTEPCVGAAITHMKQVFTRDLVPSIMEAVAAELGGSSASPGSTPLLHFEVVLHLLTTSTFRPVVVTPALITQLCEALTAAPPPGTDPSLFADFRDRVLAALEALTQQPELLLSHYTVMLDSVVPALAGIAANTEETGDTRYNCLIMLCDVVLLFLRSPTLYRGDEDSEPPATATEGAPDAATLTASTARIDAMLNAHIVPLIPISLAEEEGPMPLYPIKLLVAMLDRKLSWIRVVEQLGLLPTFFEYLSIDHRNNNVHNIKLCRLVLVAGSLTPTQVRGWNVVPRVAAVMEYAHQNSVDTFLEPVLELCVALLERDEAGLAAGDAAAGSTSCLVPVLPILLELAGRQHEVLAALAAQCVLQLSRLFPGQAAEQVASLDGAAAMLDALQGRQLGDGVPSGYVLQRLLAAVGVAQQEGGQFATSDRQMLVATISDICEGRQDAAVVSSATETLRQLQL